MSNVKYIENRLSQMNSKIEDLKEKAKSLCAMQETLAGMDFVNMLTRIKNLEIKVKKLQASFQERAKRVFEIEKNYCSMANYDKLVRRIIALEKMAKTPTIIAAVSPLTQMMGMAENLMKDPAVLKQMQEFTKKELRKKLTEEE